MQLTKTNGGNWAKQVGIGSGVTSLAIFTTLAEAEAALAKYQPGVSIETCQAGAKLVERLGIPLGATCYMVGRAKKKRQVMQHASAAECAAAGRTPGPCNL